MLLDDGIDEWYTVVGFWFESMERWAESYHVDTPLLAEEKAQEHARSKFMHLGVVAVIKGRIGQDVEIVDNYATYVDPQCETKDQMAARMEDLGLWKLGELMHKKPAKTTEEPWWRR